MIHLKEDVIRDSLGIDNRLAWIRADMGLSQSWYKKLFLLIDGLIAILAWHVAVVLSPHFEIAGTHFTDIGNLSKSLIFSAAFLVGAVGSGAYTQGSLTDPIRAVVAIAIASGVAGIAIVGYAYLTSFIPPGRYMVLGASTLLFFVLSTLRISVGFWLKFHPTRIIVYGEESVLRVIERETANRPDRFEIVEFVK